MNLFDMISFCLSYTINAICFLIPSSLMAMVVSRSITYKPSDITLPTLYEGTNGTEWTYSDLLLNLKSNNVDSVTILDNRDMILTIDKNYIDNTILVDNVHIIKTLPSITENIIQRLNEYRVTYDISSYDIMSHGSNYLYGYIWSALRLLFTYMAFMFCMNIIRIIVMKNNPLNSITNMGNISTDLVKPTMINTMFHDVAGCDEAKFELTEIIDFLKAPEKFANAGAKIPAGVLLEGPPGTGKTLLARATAGEANVSFIPVSGSQFIEMFVGVGASRVRQLFELAEENKPCIIFIDEIDTIGRQRGSGFAGGNDEREQTLNQILTSMDGFNKKNGIIVLAATNRADILDSALTRPGRFDRKIGIGLPDIAGRKQIMDVHFKNKKLSNDVDFDEFAALTAGFSGADIANLANEAAILSVRYNEPFINNKCISDAFEKITIGLPKKDEIREGEVMELVAYHEAGHTMMVKLFDDFFDLRKVTITSNHNGAGGYTLFTPKERYANYPTKKFMLANIIVALGGRAAEVMLYKQDTYEDINYSDNILFPKVNDLQITTGASNDLKQAHSIARRYVSLFGLGKHIGVYDSRMEETSHMSEYTKETIDKEVKEMVKYAYVRALDILKCNEDAFHNLGKILLEKTVVDSCDLQEINVTYHKDYISNK